MTVENSAHATILNVDDHEASRYSKTRILRSAGYHVLDAASGNQALVLMRSHRPDLVLLDVKLPDIDGYEVCRRIRASPEVGTTPVLQTSASFVDLNARVRALEGGADSYLTAPFEPEVLIASVRALLRMRRAEHELLETREAFRATFEQAPVAIAHVAADGSWLRVNPRTLELLALPGKPATRFVECLPVAARAAVEAGLARLFADELETFVSEQSLVDAGGHATEVNLTASLAAAPGGGRYAIVLMEDLRERKRAESMLRSHETRLRDSEERFRQFADNSGDVLWIYDVETQGYEFISVAFEDVWGFPRAEVLEEPRRWLDAVYAPDREDVRASLECVLAGLTASTLYRVIRPDGALRWIDDRRFPIHQSDGSVRRVAGIAQDVTRARVAEEERAQLLTSERAARLEAEHSSQLKEQFLATLSHELRTPLHAILGWTHLLRRRKTGTDEIAEGLEVIERNARAQTHLISDLLDVSRIMAGKVQLESRAVELAEVVGAASEVLRPDAQAKSITLRTQLGALGESVLGDPARLQQIVWNLVSNAIKFTPSGGEVEVTLARRGRMAELTVRDTGQGIAPAYLPHIFERFSQGDPVLARKHGGLGLGLSIVHSLVELHGGRVHAHSEGEGRGARFVVELPLGRHAGAREHDGAPEEAAPAPSDADESRLLTGLRVLLVDDEESGREFVRRLLCDSGAEVRSVGSASEAVRAAGEFAPDVLVSDIGMPEMNGYELLHALRARTPAGVTPFPAVALTAYARDEDRRRAAREGYARHLSKPVGAAELLRALLDLAPKRTGTPISSASLSSTPR